MPTNYNPPLLPAHLFATILTTTILTSWFLLEDQAIVTDRYVPKRRVLEPSMQRPSAEDPKRVPVIILKPIRDETFKMASPSRKAPRNPTARHLPRAW